MYHLLVLPSWDDTRQAEGETVYRVGTRSRRLFSSIPDLIEYYTHKRAFKDPESGKRFRLIYFADGVDGYADIAAAEADAAAMAELHSADTSDGSSFSPRGGGGSGGAYADVPGGGFAGPAQTGVGGYVEMPASTVTSSDSFDDYSAAASDRGYLAVPASATGHIDASEDGEATTGYMEAQSHASHGDTNGGETHGGKKEGDSHRDESFDNNDSFDDADV